MGLLSKLDDAIQALVKMGYPESTAAKIASGELPMDRQSQINRAMYYYNQDINDPIWHSTRKDFTVVDPRKVDLGLHAGTAEQATNRLRDTYNENLGRVTPELDEGAQMMPLGRPLSGIFEASSDAGHWLDSTKALDVLHETADMDAYLNGNTRADVSGLKGLLDDANYMRNEHSNNLSKQSYWTETPENRALLDAASQNLQNSGFGSVKYDNFVENDYGKNAGLLPWFKDEARALDNQMQDLNRLAKSRYAEQNKPPSPDDFTSEAQAARAVQEWLMRDRSNDPPLRGLLSADENALYDNLYSKKKAIEDNPDNYSDNASYILLGGNNARSALSAAFDPDNIGKPYLLGANAGKSNVATTAAEQTAEPLRDLMFMHNTSPDKLQRFAEIGGMPMPSIGVTRKDIPFEGYGDITLLGKPSSLDPAIKGNTAWNADAYTVRAPGPVQMSKKGAFKQLDADFSEFRDLGNVDHARQMLSNLETKGSLNEYEYNDFIRFMEDSPAVKAKWLRDVKGVELPVGKNGKLDRYGISDLVRDNDSEFRAWAANKAQDYFEPEKYLITNPNRDYYKSRASIKPYTAENVTSFMKKYKGAAQEGSMTTAGTGANRAATAKQLKSLDDMRAERGLLASREDVSIDKNTFSMMQDDLMEALKPYYKYDADGWRYLNEAGEMLVATDKKGMDKAMREYGFENVPDSIKQEIRDWKDSMRSAKTEYFESKPERVVGLNDFGGAIVPENTPQGILDMLSNAGVRVEKYADEVQRTELRNKFNDLMFSNPTGGLMSQIAGLDSFKDGAQDPSRQAASQRFTEMGLNPDTDYNYGTLLPIKRAISSKDREGDLLGGYRPAVPGLLRDLMYQYLLAEEASKRGNDKQAADAAVGLLF